MPVVQKFHFICSITGAEVVSNLADLPERWGNVNGDVFSPEGIWIIATRVLAHPDRTYAEITGTPYPDAVLDVQPGG